MIAALAILAATLGLIGLSWVLSDLVAAWPRLVRLMKGTEK